MSKYYYSGTVEVEIQGPRVLELVERNRNHARYHVIGFNKTVSIIDYRINSLKALDAALSGADKSAFAYAFSSNAVANVTVSTDDLMTIELCEATEHSADDMLLIVVGLKSHIPSIDFTVRKIEKLEDGTYGFIGLACHELAPHSLEPISFSEPLFSSVPDAVLTF